MRASGIRTGIFLSAVALGATRPTALSAQRYTGQGAQAAAVMQATVPSIVKYIVDESVRTPDGAPTVRLITNDPAIRAAFAHGVTPEVAPVLLASLTPEQSGHAKGDERLDSRTEGPTVLRYTVAAP